MIKWYLNRLKTISIVELFYRISQLFQNLLERLFCVRKFPGEQTIKTRGILFKISPNQGKIYSDTINIFGKSFNYSKSEINWHKDIFSNHCFHLDFSKRINIRKKSKLSAKNVWEINRLQFLTFIALNYRNTESDLFLDKFTQIVNSWIDNNPYLLGVNWYSNIEINIRLIVWFFCWQILDADNQIKTNDIFKKFVDLKWNPSIYQHCKYSYAHPSKYSSSNNHLIAEFAGLFIASSFWHFKESERWKRYSKKGLEREIKRQHSLDGINKEEAAEYIQFITDFFLVSYIVGEKTNNSFSEEYKIQLKKIFYYIYNFLDLNGNFPKYGDEDDGKSLLFDQDEYFNNFTSLLTSGAIIFNDPVLKSKCNGLDQKNLILFGDSCIKNYHDIDVISPEQKSSFYTNDGHFILRKQINSEEVYLHFDAAPLGFLSIAAHGHADALSFIIHIDGQPVFIDPGTYTYHTELEWRYYFTGTLAHNTVRINKSNQALIAGPTLWIDHYKTKVLNADTTENQDIVIAQHNGYKHLGIIHTRGISFDKRSHIIIISDRIESRTNNAYLLELPFHFHPVINVININNNKFLIINPKGRDVSLTIDNRLYTQIVRGQTNPELIGWYSKSFMNKEPCNTILCSQQVKGDILFETIISIT
jgi:hypothetical protein